jgi:ATP-dependent Lon protease
MDKKEAKMIKDLPILPLRETVLFPYTITPLFVGRKISISAVEDAMLREKVILAITQKEKDIEEPEPKDLYTIGTVAEILQLLRLSDGTMKVLVEGLFRAKIEDIKTEPFLLADAERVAEKLSFTKRTKALIRHLRARFTQFAKLSGENPQLLSYILETEDPSQLSDMVAAHLKIEQNKKQRLLSEPNPQKRLSELTKILAEEQSILDIEREIEKKIKKQMAKTQKEYYLTEKMRAIQKELEKEGEDEIESLSLQIKRADLPKEARKKAERELVRLKKTPYNSAERAVVRNYIDWLLGLPWKREKERDIDLAEAERILEEDHWGLHTVKERVLEFLAVRKLTKKMPSCILCFVGPPGVGKSSVAKSMAKALRRRFTRLSLGGLRDEAEIRGHRMTYVAAMPGRIIQQIRKVQSNNPVFLLDEVDKMCVDFKGDPSAALLEVFDPDQNHSFCDHYLDVEFDLSDVIFIATANTLHSVPLSLLDRMEVLEFDSYTDYEKLQIAKRFLVPKNIESHGLKKRKKYVEISEDAIRKIIDSYTQEAGVRNLDKRIAEICRKVAKEIATAKRPKKVLITPESLVDYLGSPPFKESLCLKDKVGVAYGLAYTERGGETLVCETAKLIGTGRLYLTGKLGDVMKESAKTALSYIRSKAESLSLSSNFYRKYDFHIHILKGAIPKDGPSAGMTIAVAMVSSLLNSPIHSKTAMTGEITLTGDVLGVGRINEKLLAAHRAGFSKVIIPKENENDLVDVPDEVKKGLEIIPVRNMDEVIREVGLKMQNTKCKMQNCG